MDIISTTLPINQDNLFELQKLIEAKLSDPRNKWKITYPLCTIMVIVILAKEAGCLNCCAIRRYWITNKEKLQELIYGLTDEVASAQTIRRVQTIIKTDELDELLRDFLASQRIIKQEVPISLQYREVVPADGQNMRATRSHINGDARLDSGYDVVSLYFSTLGFTLSQVVVDKKNHEADSIIQMLDKVNVENSILVWDAINTRTKTLETVISHKADYLVSLKSNQGLLFEEVTTAFEFVDSNRYAFDVLSSQRTSSEHGRIEDKTIEIIEANKALSKAMQKKWASVKSLIRVTTTRTQKISGISQNTEHRYFISSIDMDGTDESFAATMQDIILKRWAIESRHWVIDVVFGQDALPLRNQDYIKNSTIITKMAVNILSFIREHAPMVDGKPQSFESLQILARQPQIAYKFMEAFYLNNFELVKEDEFTKSCLGIKDEVFDDDLLSHPEQRSILDDMPEDTLLAKAFKARTKKK